jgi:hypothetical protein
MARCEQGYRCDVCGHDVESIADSDLYLRFLLGEVDFGHLHVAPERHIRCNPSVAQFIADPGFPPVACEGAFARENLDPASVADDETRITAAWRRLQALARDGIPLQQYAQSVCGRSRA